MNKTEHWSVACTPVEKRALLALARREKRKPSELLRELVRLAALERGLWPADPGDGQRRQAVAT